jgi:hypothetical protein
VQRRDSPKCKSAGSPGPGEQAVLSREEQTGERRGEEGGGGAASAPGTGDMSLRPPVLRVTVKEGPRAGLGC